MPEDKRQHPRFDCQISSIFNVPEAPVKLAETMVRDISEGGVRFRSNHFIPVRNRLSFNLNIPKKKPIEAVLKPAWITEIPRVGQYEIGAYFITLNQEDKKILRDWMEIQPVSKLL